MLFINRTRKKEKKNNVIALKGDKEYTEYDILTCTRISMILSEPGENN